MQTRRSAWRAAAAERSAAEEERIRKMGADELERHVPATPVCDCFLPSPSLTASFRVRL